MEIDMVVMNLLLQASSEFLPYDQHAHSAAGDLHEQYEREDQQCVQDDDEPWGKQIQPRQAATRRLLQIDENGLHGPSTTNVVYDIGLILSTIGLLIGSVVVALPRN